MSASLLLLLLLLLLLYALYAMLRTNYSAAECQL
jgi:hypothetical protein